MPLDDHHPEFRQLAPMPPGVRYHYGPVERILQNQMPPRPDAHSYSGSTGALAADAELAEAGWGELTAARRARDAARKRRKRAAARE
jgi:hypothetical protein